MNLIRHILGKSYLHFKGPLETNLPIYYVFENDKDTEVAQFQLTGKRIIVFDPTWEVVYSTPKKEGQN